MSQGQSLGIGGLSYKATADLSGTAADVTGGNAIGTTYKNGIGIAVIADASNANQVVIAGANAVILGVLMNNPKAGEAAAIQSVRGSSCKVVVGTITSIAPNAKLITDSNCAFVIAGSTAKNVVAIAMETPTAAGDLIEAVLLDGYVA